MKTHLAKVYSAAMILALVVSLTPWMVPPTQAASATIVISQIYGGGGNSGAIYTNDFVELFNRGNSTVSLDGWSIQYTSATGTGNFGSSTTMITPLSGSLAPGQYLLIQEAAGNTVVSALPTPDVTDSTPINMSGTGGKVALVNTTTSLGCNGGSTACSAAALATIVDLVGWDGANFYETTGVAGTSAAPATTNPTAILRNNGGCTDTDNNGADFGPAATPAPRNTASPINLCTAPPDAAPSILSTEPADGVSSVPYDANVTVTFSEAVNVTEPWYTLTCSLSGVHTAVVSGGPTSFTLDPDVDFVSGDNCTLTVLATQVADQDANDPPDNMAMDFSIGFSTADACALPYTPIYAIQGSGATAAVTGNVTTQGVVVGDYEGASPQLRGFFVQDLNGDGDPATSDGLFVFNGNNNSVALGDVVRVAGKAEEYQGQTQISGVSSVVNCGTGTIAPVDVTLPFAAADEAERYEGMLVRLPQTLYVTELYQLGRFDEVLLSSDGRLQQPTNVTTPGAAAQALQAQANLNQLLLDDASQAQNPDPIVFGRNGQPLSASNTLRGGDTTTGIIGIMTYTWGGNSASPNAYRVRPLNALGGFAQFEAANPRPADAPAPTGRLRVAGMNLLNFFNSFANCSNGVGGAPATSNCRGAENAAEFDRQWHKTVAAILGTQADVVGLTEMENDGYGPDSAIQFLVDQLNAATAPGTYAFIDADAGTGQVNALGLDAIKVALVYKTAKVTPVGVTAALNSDAFVNGGDSAPRNRAALAQAFEEVGTGARFVVSVNHLKSKGSACEAPDLGDGQGNCNVVRTNAANVLTAWLASDPTGTGDPDALIVGDLNSYAMEDPITTIKNAGYTNLVYQFDGDAAYSYVFDGLWGYLDHALSNAGLTPQVTGVADWHINADEPSVLDYNTNFKTAGQQASLYAPDAYRAADHDPVLIDLNLRNDPPVASAGGPYSAAEGTTVALTASGSDPDGTPVTFAWDLNNDGTFETPGQNVIFNAVDGTIAYPVSVKVTDGTGQSTVAQAVVDIANVAPVVGTLVAPTDPVLVNTPINTQVDFTDAGVLDTHTAAWDWGDGTTSAGVVNETNGSGLATGTHSYAQAGIYPVSVTVTDKDGDSASATFESVIVYDPDGGFVTGGGWFRSPAGAYQANPSATGRAVFAFAAKYLKHVDVPLGAVEFLLPSARLRFHSLDAEWLVVNRKAGTAQLQGVGTLNGEGAYAFRVWVTSGAIDTFRIRIWSVDASGAEVVVYDNGAGQPTGGGNIVIHK